MHGKGAHKYDNVHIGINGRLDTIQAAVLLEKLPIFEEEITLRNRVAQRYGEPAGGTGSSPRRCVPVLPPSGRNIRYSQQKRDAIAQELGQKGIPSAVYYPRPLHRQTAYSGYPCAPDLSVSERLAATVLSPAHASVP